MEWLGKFGSFQTMHFERTLVVSLHSLNPLRPKLGYGMRQPMFFQNAFFENFRNFLILPFTITISIPFYSSTLMFIIYNWFYQYLGHTFIKINKKGYSLNPCLHLPPLPSSKKLKSNPRSPISSLYFGSSTELLYTTYQRSFFT